MLLRTKLHGKTYELLNIGIPLMDGRVVPLSVKTLIFYH